MKWNNFYRVQTSTSAIQIDNVEDRLVNRTNQDCAITTQYISDSIFGSLFIFLFSPANSGISNIEFALRRLFYGHGGSSKKQQEDGRVPRNRLPWLFDNLTPKRLGKYYMYR